MKKTLHKWSLGKSRFAITKTTLLAFLLVSACQNQSSKDSNTDSFDPDRDYFPDKVQINHSVGFDVEYHKNYKLLHLFRHYNDAVDTLSFVLVQRGTPSPEVHADLPSITVPVENIVSVSTTHLGMFEMLDAFDQLKGVEVKQYVSNPTVRALVDSGDIVEVAPAGTLNVETVISLGVDLLMGVGYPNSQNEAYQQLERTGIPVLLNADWQEANLLGRAEWVKLLAILLNKEASVNESFGLVVREYQETLDLVQSRVTEGPMAITGIAEGDAWHVAGGGSFAYNILRIAKVEYPWKNDRSTGSLRLDFETVYEFGVKADFWIAPSHARTLEAVLQRDSRYADFKSIKNGQVYNIYGRYIEGGGNDYYETGVVEPHVILKDVVKIFHPDLLPDHELVYYSKLK